MVENVIQIKSRIKINAVASGKIEKKQKKKNLFAKIIIFGILLNVVAKMVNI